MDFGESFSFFTELFLVLSLAACVGQRIALQNQAGKR